MHFRTARLIAACASTAALAGTASATLWDQGGGADTSYTNPLNWAGDTVPLATFVEIKDSTDVVSINANTTGGRAFIENKPTIDVTADITFSGGSMNIQSVDWTQTAGTVNFNQSGALPFGSVSSLTADLDLSGGAFRVNGAGQTTAITNVFGTAIETGQASGNLDISLILGNDGGGAANVTVSGSAEMKSRVGVALAGGSSFTVVGSGADINFGELASFAGSWYQAAGAELSYEIDAGGVSTIFIDQGTDLSRPVKHVAFEDGALLDLSFIVPPVTTTSYTLISFENGDIKNDQGGLGGTGLAYVAGFDDTFWDITVDNSGADGLLIATYTVPEPGTFALLGLGGLMIARRRRA